MTKGAEETKKEPINEKTAESTSWEPGKIHRKKVNSGYVPRRQRVKRSISRTRKRGGCNCKGRR